MKPYFTTALTASESLPGDASLFTAAIRDVCEAGLDVNDYLVRHRAASFYFTVDGDSMSGAGILHGDRVLVDRAVTPRHGHIVVAILDNVYTLKRFLRRGDGIELRAENPAYPSRHVRQEETLQVWGVVVGVVRKLAI